MGTVESPIDARMYEGKQLFPASVLRVASDLSQTGLSLPKKLVSSLMPALLLM